MKTKVNIFLILIMIIFFIFSMLISLSYYNIMFYSVLVSYFLALIVVNNNNYAKNIINLPTVFLAGFGVFLLGRFFAILINSNLNNYLYCIDFIFNYCASSDQAFYLVCVLNLILIFFSLSFAVVGTVKVGVNSFKLKNNVKLFTFICLFFVLFSLYYSIESIYKAINSGYMALYASQAEAYQSPYVLLINSIASASLAFLYSIRERISNKFFLLIFLIYVLSLLLTVLTGSRSGFIAGLIIFLWLFYKNKKIKFHKIIILASITLIGLFSLDKLASFTGAREFNNTTSMSLSETLSEVIYGQGVTLMVFNTSMSTENYPLLGFLKVILPGIQGFYSFFGIDKRYQFDWSSYMTYNENKIAYDEGYGLGWSIFSDLYIISFGFLPLFCFFVYIFGLFIVKIISKESCFNNGLIFISIIYFFALNRGSISPYIFTLIIYIFLSIYYGTLSFKRRKIN